jgi:hypothetical protein
MKIKEKIDENIYLFLDYMSNRRVPTTDFLAIIVGLYDSFSEEAAIKLFVRVCAMH